MNLKELDIDALTELFNIGLHRAAASLSELTSQRIIVDLPELWVCPLDQMHGRLTGVMGGELATVHQVFTGAMRGDAVLVLEYDNASRLAALMTKGGVAAAGRLDQSAREVLSEVGNIILGSCLSAFGDMLRVSVSFAVPRMHVESLDDLLQSLVVEDGELQIALLAATRFRLTDQEVGGHLIIGIGLASLEVIARSLEARELA